MQLRNTKHVAASSVGREGTALRITAQHIMPSLFPTTSALNATFGQASPYQTLPKRKDISYLYTAWDVTEDAKNKATQLSDKAAAELAKASNIAQEKTGKIKLYSGKYYAACTFGGLMACGLTH
ncbi:hypothetical protein BST61_g3619 [Cercospora zeina]